MAETIVHYSGPVLSRREAAATRQTRYFTGEPCKHGHIAQRMTVNSCCFICLLGRTQKFWRDYREASLARNKRWRLKNIEHVRIMGIKNSRKFRKRRPDVIKKLNESVRTKKVTKQEKIAGRIKPSHCDICGEKKRYIVFDHCHAHGNFRGWLCNSCNVALGLVKDNSSLLRKMAKYLDAQPHGKIGRKRAEFAPLEGLWASSREEISFGKS